MEKVFTFFNRSVTRVWMLVMAAVICSLSANAASVDVGAITLGQEFKVPSMGVATGTFTAPQSGTVTVTGVAAHGIEVCTDPEMTQAVEINTTAMYFPFTDEFEAEAGKTYYVRITEQWMMELNVVFSMAGVGETPLQIVDMYPAEGTLYDLANDGAADLQFTFNQPVKCGQGYFIMYKDPTAPETLPEAQQWLTKNYPSGVVLVNGTLVSVVGVQANLIALMNQRHFENTEIRVVLNNLQTTSGQPLENGKFMADNPAYTYFQFKVGKQPLSLSSVAKPSQFLSYWLPESGEAKFEAVFNGNLGTEFGTELKICYGNPEIENGYYEESVPLTYDGNKITADLSGKLRTPATMLPLTLSKYSDINLRLGPVCDELGGSVVGNSAGSPGVFVWNMPYTLIERANVAFEFTPGTGASLQGKDEIELWINSLSTISFTGFKFEYTDANGNEAVVVVPVADAKYEQGDTSDEAIYTIPVPEACKNAKGITVTLDGLKSTDGYDHFGEVKAVYGKMAITSANPANASSIEVLKAGTIITVEATTAAAYPEMVMVYEIEDLNPEDPEEAIIKTESYMTRNDDGSYSSEVFGNYTMYTGHQYKVTFTAWADENEKNYGESLGSDYIVWNGATAPYTFSNVQFLGITPAEGTTIGPDERMFTVKFNKVVTIKEGGAVINMGQGLTTDFESVEAVDPDSRFVDMVYAKEWILTVPESYMNKLEAQLDFSFQCYDENEVLVKGNFGKEANSRFYFSYDYAGRYADVNVAYVDGQLVASHDMGLMPSYLVPYSDAYVMTKGTREVVAKVADLKMPINDMDFEESLNFVNTEVYMVLDQELPLNEAYVLYIPANYFNIGTEFNQKNSAEKYFSFYAEEPAEPIELNLTTDPEQGTVESLQSIEVIFNNYDEVGLGSGKISLYRNKQWLEDLEDPELDWDMYNKVILHLSQKYTEPGAYTLFVPEGLFMLGMSGEPAPAFTLTYTIEGGAEEPVELNITVTPAEGPINTTHSEIHIWFNDYETAGNGEGKATLTINDNEPVELPDAEYGEDWNEMIQGLGDDHTADGKYVVSFPAGYFELGTGVKSPAFTLTHTIDRDGVSTITINADGITKVYDLNGVLRVNGDNGQIKNLPAGIYIMNGKKVVIK